MSNKNKPNQILNHKLEMINDKNKNIKDCIQFQSQHLILDQKCIQSGNLQGDRISLEKCDEEKKSQKWKILNNNQIQSLSNHLCMETIGNNNEIRMWDCDSDLNSQKWNWTR
jgi:hypothetical protein